MELIETPNPNAKKILTDREVADTEEKLYKIEGIKSKTIAESILDQLQLKDRSPFVEYKVKLDLANINNSLSQSGYYFSTVEVTVEENNNDNTQNDKSELLKIEGIKSVFLGPGFITITKEENIEWESINQDIISIFDKL